MNFTNAQGKMTVANSQLKFQDMNVTAFGGTLIMNGLYSTVDKLKPEVNFDLSLKEVVFNDIFGQVGTLQNFAPIFNKATGRFSTKLTLSSLLKSDMMPDLNSIIGKGTLSSKSVGLKDVPVFQALATALKKDDLLPMTIKDLGLLFEIKDGNVITKPFSFKVADVNMTLVEQPD
jgi:hypothetical protein